MCRVKPGPRGSAPQRLPRGSQTRELVAVASKGTPSQREQRRKVTCRPATSEETRRVSLRGFTPSSWRISRRAPCVTDSPEASPHSRKPNGCVSDAERTRRAAAGMSVRDDTRTKPDASTRATQTASAVAAECAGLALGRLLRADFRDFRLARTVCPAWEDGAAAPSCGHAA